MNAAKNLRSKLFIPLIFLFVAIFFLSSYIIIQRETTNAKETLLSNARSYAKLSVEYIIEDYELYYDSGFIKFKERMVELLSLNENIIRIQIIDLNGKIHFDSSELENGKYNKIQDGIRYVESNEVLEKSRQQNVSVIESTEKSYIEIIQPYLEEWGRHDYSVRYFITQNQLTALNNKILFEVFLSIGVFLLITFVVIILLFRRLITTPIRKLSEGINQIKMGNFTYHISSDSEDEIGELTSNFNHMVTDLKESKEQLEYSIEQKNQLMLQLSHDLKTPLGPILNLLKIIRANENDKENEEMIDVIQKNVDYMKNLVNNSIDLARLNSPQIDNNVSEIKIKQFINKYVNNKMYLLENKSISFNNQIPEDLSVVINEYDLEVVISNLIQNAINYTNKEGNISIHAQKENGFIQIAVKDTGIGMNQDQIDHAFEEFYKADNSRHDLSSTGLGLSICKRIVEKYGGRIWIESDGIGKGITVFFTITI